MTDIEPREIVLVPGLIRVSPWHKFGAPTLVGTGLPYTIGRIALEDPENWEISREQAVALAAFQAGVEWQRSHKLRKQVTEMVEEVWRQHYREQEAAGTPRLQGSDLLALKGAEEEEEGNKTNGQ